MQTGFEPATIAYYYSHAVYLRSFFLLNYYTKMPVNRRYVNPATLFFVSAALRVTVHLPLHRARVFVRFGWECAVSSHTLGFIKKEIPIQTQANFRKPLQSGVSHVCCTFLGHGIVWNWISGLTVVLHSKKTGNLTCIIPPMYLVPPSTSRLSLRLVLSRVVGWVNRCVSRSSQ